MKDFIHDPYLKLYVPLWLKDAGSFTSEDAYGHLCTVTGAAWRLDGRGFNGSSDLIDISGALTALDATSRGTILAWVYATAIPGASMSFFNTINTASDTGGRMDFQILSTGKLRLFARDNAGASSVNVSTDTVYSAATWYFVGINIDDTGSTRQQITVGGIDQAITYASGSGSAHHWFDTIGTHNKLEVGRYGGATPGAYWNGRIGEIWVYGGRVLPISEHRRKFLETKWRYA